MGLRVNFMLDYLEFGNFYSLDIYVDEIYDGKLSWFNVFI